MRRGVLLTGDEEGGCWKIWLNSGSGGMVGWGFVAGDKVPFSARRTISFKALVTTPARITKSRREVVSKGSFFCDDLASLKGELYSTRCW